MLQNKKTIIKIDAKNSFLDIQEAFSLGSGKVCFQFRKYDPEASAGNKIKSKVDFYMNMEEFSYFSEIMKTGRIKKMSDTAKAASDGKFPKPGYHVYGGTRDGKISRQLKVESGDGEKLFLKALSGPGKVSATGAIQPMYKDAEATEKIALVLTREQCMKIGLAGERAIRYFDIWNANGVLEEKTKALAFTKADEAPGSTSSARDAEDDF